MAQQLTVQACFLAYIFSFATTGMIWLVRKDNFDCAAVTVEAE